MNKVKVYVEVCREGVELPQYAREGDAGMDVRAAELVFFQPHETKIVPTGIKMAIPPGYEVQVRPRSGMSAKTSFRVANAPGTVDSGYRGEIGVIMDNTADFERVIHPGDRIAQLVLKEVPVMEFEVVSDINVFESQRGDGGFGSTGSN